MDGLFGEVDGLFGELRHGTRLPQLGIKPRICRYQNRDNFATIAVRHWCICWFPQLETREV